MTLSAVDQVRLINIGKEQPRTRPAPPAPPAPDLGGKRLRVTSRPFLDTDKHTKWMRDLIPSGRKSQGPYVVQSRGRSESHACYSAPLPQRSLGVGETASLRPPHAAGATDPSPLSAQPPGMSLSELRMTVISEQKRKQQREERLVQHGQLHASGQVCTLSQPWCLCSAKCPLDMLQMHCFTTC